MATKEFEIAVSMIRRVLERYDHLNPKDLDLTAPWRKQVREEIHQIETAHPGAKAEAEFQHYGIREENTDGNPDHAA